MAAILFRTALRNSEIANIKMSDIEEIEVDGRTVCRITIVSKGGDQAYTYLDEKLYDMLKEYVAKDRKTDSPYLFYGVRGRDSKKGNLNGSSINHRVQACVERAGINKKVTTHTTRRTAITHMAISRNSLAAQMLARHKNQRTTEGYIHAGDEFVKELLLGN
jgi:integrase